MARFGINPDHTLGVSIPLLREIAMHTGHDHLLAKRLWTSGVHEARILASMIDDPERVSPSQMERWATAFDSWDVCDQCCSNLFEDTSFARDKAISWSFHRKEFVKRAGFVLMARLAVGRPTIKDTAYAPFLRRIVAEAHDDRPMVRKAINWALRQIGKRSAVLHREALSIAQTLATRPDRAARWIGADAVRELSGRTAKLIVQRHERKRSIQNS
jgi:3-methyladenine DNA glycosylase AlkD